MTTYVSITALRPKTGKLRRTELYHVKLTSSDSPASWPLALPAACKKESAVIEVILKSRGSYDVQRIEQGLLCICPIQHLNGRSWFWESSL